MVNTHPLVSGISARWTRAIFLCLAFLLAFPTFLFSQEQGDPLSDRERRKFNELFFEAEKEKNLGNVEQALEIYEELYELYPSNATVSFELAQIYAAMDRPEKAAFHAKQAVELEPENKWMLMLLASVYRSYNETDKEIEVFKQLVNLDSLNPDYRFELSLAYQAAGKPQQAIRELNALEKIVGANEIISNQKKLIYLEEGDLESAVEEMENLIKTFPLEIDYYGTLAQIYMVNGLEDEAVKVYEEMLKIAPEDPRPHLDLAEYYKNHKQFDKSIFHLRKAMNSPELEIDKKIAVLLSLYEACENDSVVKMETYGMLQTMIAQNPNDPKAYAIYGDFLSRDNDTQGALAMYKKAVSLEGGGIYDIWNQILLIEIQNEMYDSILVDGPKAIGLYPNQPVPYFFTGIAFGIKDHLEQAAEYLENGLNYVIGQPVLKEQFYTQLADVYHRMEEHETSDTYFDKALALNPDNPTALNNYAYYLSVRGEKLDKALEMTEKSNRLSPDNATFLDTWAWVLFKKGEYKKALEKIEQVLKLGGGHSGEVLEHYGDILHKNGKTDEALDQWKKAKILGSTSDQIDQKINTGKTVE